MDTTPKLTTIRRKIGQNRGKARLWIEGAYLTASGFPHGTQWSVTRFEWDGAGFVLLIEARPRGDRKIAGTTERPIIDINSGELLAGFGPMVEIACIADGILAVRNVEGA